MSLKNRRHSLTLGVWETQRLCFKGRWTSECSSVDAKIQTTTPNYSTTALKRLGWVAEKSGFISFRGLFSKHPDRLGYRPSSIIGYGRTLRRRKSQGSAHPFRAAVQNVRSCTHIHTQFLVLIHGVVFHLSPATNLHPQSVLLMLHLQFVTVTISTTIHYNTLQYTTISTTISVTNSSNFLIILNRWGSKAAFVHWALQLCVRWGAGACSYVLGGVLGPAAWC
jgi:hypothetical protein